MPLDTLTLSAVIEELDGELEDAKIDKIQQPERDVLILTVRGRGYTRKLLVSAGSGSARLHITEHARENPQEPPAFCMLLRKHLAGARIQAITQPGADRIARIECLSTDDLGDTVSRQLVVELTGKTTNIVLVGQDGRIIDCLRKSDGGDAGRSMMPGMFYRFPEKQLKADPFVLTKEETEALWKSADYNSETDKWVLKTFGSLSPLMCREASFRIFGDSSIRIHEAPAVNFPDAFSEFIAIFREKRTAPYLLSEEGIAKDISCIDIRQYGHRFELKRYRSYSELLDAFFTLKEKEERNRQRKQSLMKTAKTLRDRAERKLSAQREELGGTLGRDELREHGDIIKANIYRMEKGMSVLTAENFFSPDGAEKRIPLDPKLTPQQNAAKYYKAYSKAKKAEYFLREQIIATKAELEYLESIVSELELADGEKEISDIRTELIEQGFIKPRTNMRKKGSQSAPMHFVSSAGIEILVGRNNLQNDAITFGTAFRNDLWLHTQRIHGAHVIVSHDWDNVDDTTLAEAAGLAAWFSQGRGDAAVDVDYTRAGNVKKPSGARPGMVIYSGFKTIRVRPDPLLAERLIKHRK